MRIHANVQIFAGMLVIATLGMLWLTRKGAAESLGYSIGGAAGDAVVGVIGGVNDALGIPRTSDVVDWANSDKNPLRSTGSWVGTSIYDWTH